MKLKNFFKLMGALVVCQLAGITGSLFTISQIQTWYPTLIKPPLNPPAWLFGPVWTILYLLMGVALYLIWQSNSKDKKRALWLFAVQLILNAIWSPIFFGAHAIGSALAIIVLMWAAIVMTILIFKKISKPAAALLVPYIAWVSFATYLNFALWWLNR
jgi:tryptophan-rich sensory protein